MTEQAPLEVLFLDAAGTLIAPDPGVGAVYARVAGEHGVRVEPEALEQGFYVAWKAARDLGRSYGRNMVEAREFWRGVVESAFASAGAPWPGGTYFDDVFAAFSERRAWRVYDDVEAALEIAEGRGVRLGVLSNFDARLPAILSSLGLDSRFDPVVVSFQHGMDKPDIGFFEAARGLAGSPPAARCGLVGDTPREDFDGASAAGWRAALVARTRPAQANAGDRPHFASLVEAVESLLP